MAVSFKVPASPKKDIFNINTFLGVDLTNSGADMDEVRSPNAENMVRYVPGKVRKRTGYRKEILFSPNVNVNFAAGTSSVEQIFTVSESEIWQDINIYRLIIKFGSGAYADDVYVEFDYKSERDFNIGYGDTTPASAEWAHYSGSIRLWEDDEYIYLNSQYPQTIYIKNFSVLASKDENYKWSAAPTYFITQETVEPVFGCHLAKAGTFEGNRVVNVNRALETHDYEEVYNLTSATQLIKNLGETPTPNATLCVEFDYKSTGDTIRVSFGGASYYLNPTNYYQHISVRLTYNPYPTKTFNAWSDSTSTLYIKNISVMYEKNDSYEWKAAPEDNGGTFAVGDLYYIGSKNYALIESGDEESTQSYKEFVIMEESPDLKGFNHVEFDISTSSDDETPNIEIQLGRWVDLPSGRTWSYDPDYEYIFSEHLNKKHIEIFYNKGTNYNLTTIRVNNAPETSPNKSRVTLNNIKVNTITTRGSFDMSPYNYVYHVGSNLYVRARNSKSFELQYTSANKHISRAWQIKKTLIIIDGENIYSMEIGKGKIEPIGQENAYIPLVTIAKEPSGGGTSYESFNLLQPGFYEMFQGRANIKEYQLTFGNLDPTPVKIWVMNQSGGWVPKTESTDFSVNRSTGKITFVTAPGESPITGEDNIKVLAYRTIKDYRERVTKCTHGVLYGIGGAGDRLFLAGNPDHPNWDFYSQQFDPTYFPDTNYATLGSEQSMITGYAIVNNYLATFKDGFDQSQTVFVREGDLLKTNSNTEQEESDTTEPVFKLINTLQGEGVIAPHTFGYIQTEPLFLSKHGIYAITEQDITGEKYTQSRSFYLNGKLRNEPNPENAMACIYDDQYILALNNHLYILDGLQATRTDKSEPYATRQYAGFYCTNVPALCIWQDDGVWFGTNDGRVCAFNTDIESLNSYNDEGNPIYACWETPDLDGRLFYKNKTFRYFAVRLMQAIKTSVKLYSRKLGVWNLIREESVIGNPIDFENFDFDMFSFSQDTTEKVIHTKVRVKKVDKARFRVENGVYNEPFGLFDLALEFIESGNYKG